jgi:hypothetical protein
MIFLEILLCKISKKIVTIQVLKSTKKLLFNPYDGLFARFTRKKWEEGCLPETETPFLPLFASKAAQQPMLLALSRVSK